MMDISVLVGLIGALFGSGSIIYMIVEKKLTSAKDAADINSVSADVNLKVLDGFKQQIEFLNRQLAESEAKIALLQREATESTKEKEEQNAK